MVVAAAEDAQIEIVAHPMVTIELLLGGLTMDSDIIRHLGNLTLIRTASHSEIASLIVTHRLSSHGIGYVDVNLLASCMLDAVELLSFDKKLVQAAKAVGVRVIE
jgi:hypothetical protein